MEKLDFEIYRTQTGRRVNIGDKSYALEVFTGEVNSFTVAAPFEGDVERAGDPSLEAWLKAAKEVRVPFRYAWHGIMNSLGHHGSVSAPWKARELNYARDDAAPIPERNWKVWVEWEPDRWTEYTIDDPHNYGHLSCWNEQGLCFNGYETYGTKRIATNYPAAAKHVLGKNIESGTCQEPIVVTSFDELGGELMPCPIYNK